MILNGLDFYGRSFLTLLDYSAEEIAALIEFAAVLKAEKKAGVRKGYMEGKNVALIFEKPSTRTRCSFAVAAADCGAHSDYLGKGEIHLGKKEAVEDTARVLGRFYDGIEFRGFSHKTVEDLAKHSGVPVWNGLTDDDHPTQALADFMTIAERLALIGPSLDGELKLRGGAKSFKGVVLAYFGDGRNNVANALMIASAKLGVNFVICSPECLFPDGALLEKCRKIAEGSGGSITVSAGTEAAVGANAVYTDVWVSMGEEDLREERTKQLTPYRVAKAVMDKAAKHAVFLHCLPAVKGEEVTEEVFESAQSAVFDEAENRMHTIKAVMAATVCKEQL